MNGQHEPAHARVDVHRRADAGRELRNLGNRIDHALRVLRRGADDQHRVVVDARRHRVDVGAPVVAHGDLVQRDAEVVRGLVERSVGAVGDHHLGLGDAALGAPASRAAFTAQRMLSVPPDVMKPAAPSAVEQVGDVRRRPRTGSRPGSGTPRC